MQVIYLALWLCHLLFVVPCEPYSNPNTSECLHIRDDFSIRLLVTFNTDTDHEVC